MHGTFGPAGQFLTLKETAALTGAAYATLRREIEAGRLAAYKVGRKYFIPSQQAEDYAAHRRDIANLRGYTVRQLTEILPLSYAGLIQLIKDGRLPAVRQGRRYLVTQEALDAFLQEAKI